MRSVSERLRFADDEQIGERDGQGGTQGSKRRFPAQPGHVGGGSP
jgi:hypothetical protein